MFEMFDDVFEEVMDELEISDWWELFDDRRFEIVEERITERLGHDCWEDEDFLAWNRSMGEEL